MDDSTLLLKMIFDGYVHYYGALRWHTLCRNADMTRMELFYFSDLGFKLGFISKREHSEKAPPNHSYNGASNPRDLVWFDPKEANKIFLHLERENDSRQAVDAIIGNSRLNDSARYPDNRYLVGIFGWVTPDDFNKIINAIRAYPYNNRNMLIITWIGPHSENTKTVVGLVYTKEGNCYKRSVKTATDKGGFWYLYSDPNNKWNLVKNV